MGKVTAVVDVSREKLKATCVRETQADALLCQREKVDTVPVSERHKQTLSCVRERR